MNRINLILSERERGALRRDGRLVAWLEPGRHRCWSWRSVLEVERIDLQKGWSPYTPELEALAPKGAVLTLDVPLQQIAAVSFDGRPSIVFNPGRYLLWLIDREVEVELYSTAGAICEIPESFWSMLGADFTPTRASSHQGSLLIVDGRVERRLEPGRYLICRRHHDVEIQTYDLREVEFQIIGQEVMTADKVTLRVNAIVKHRVVDPLKVFEALSDASTALYSEAQMSVRAFISGQTLDELLERRGGAQEAMTAPLRERAEAWGIEVRSVDLKDVVLPGEMKTILNQVIEAQKRAEAQGILRREETAATRSQANTARVLANNPVLLRLKELEALKEIAERVDRVTVLAGAGAEGLGGLFNLRGLASEASEEE